MGNRIYWLLGLLGAGAAYWLYTQSQAGASATGDALDFISTTAQKIGDSVTSTIRGIRNNNPGNIKYSAANNWQGQTGQDSSGFAVFDTAPNGVRAIAVILKNYSGKYGLHTVDGLIRRWSATDQDAYVLNVAGALGVDPYDSIDVTDPDTLTSLVGSIIVQEDSHAAQILLASTGAIAQGIATA
jgi:hypothetical protein